MVRDGAKDERKANRRGAARLAAVQALYQMDIAGTGLNDILAEFESHWIGREVEGAQYLPAEATFFRDVVSGVVREQRILDPLVDKVLAQGWPLKRIAATCRRVSSSLNTSTSPMPSSTRMRPGWSTPFSTKSHGSFAPASSRRSRADGLVQISALRTARRWGCENSMTNSRRSHRLQGGSRARVRGN